MKKTLLILLLLILPLQALAEVKRNLTHVLGTGSGHGMEFLIKHIADHAHRIAHHHDGGGSDADANESNTHVDNSQKSFQHLADYEQGGNANLLLPSISDPAAPILARTVPAFSPGTFANRTTIPLLRPPRALG